MKKLTAGIFTVLMGLVSVNAADAAVASKGYVDEVAKNAAADVLALEQTVAANKAAAEKLVSDYKTENDAKVNANAAAIEENAADILANTALIGENAAAISANTTAIAGEKTAREQADTALDTRLQVVEKFSGEGEGSVAKQIADAVAGEKTAREAADAQTLADAKAYTDELAEGAVAGNTAAISAMDAAYKAADASTLESAKDYADGLADNYDAKGSAAAAQAAAEATAAGALNSAKTELEGKITAETAARTEADAAINTKIGTVAEGKTVVQMITEAQTAATYDDAEVRGLISGNANAIDAIETSAYATSGITAEKVSAYDAYAAEIAGKLTDTTATGADGKYVLTAVTVGEDTTYKWELIERDTEGK